MSRFRPDKNVSQIVFDITGGEKSFTTMTMATIPKNPKIVRSKNEDFSLRTDDIDGARWKPDTRRTRDTTLNISDIEGAKPSPSFDPKSKPVDIMAVKDIAGAQPRICRNLPHSNRHTNPLNPEYQLPTKAEEPPPEIPFRYDPLNFDDIPGVHPKSYKTDKPLRDIMKVSDIEGTKPIQRIRKFDAQNRILDVSDINNDGVFHTRRTTNPLNPEYIPGEKLDFGISHSNYGSRRHDTDLSLKTSDIDGACADSSTKWYREFKNTPVHESETTEAATSLMIPSMAKQTAELEKQKAIDKMRSEKIRKFENRHLECECHVDSVQAMLRKKRTEQKSRTPTFTNNPIIL